MGGAIREVSVPYQVDTAGRDDISQSSGVIVFPPGVTQQVNIGTCYHTKVL